MENSIKKIFIPDDKGNQKRGIDIGMCTHICAYHACLPINLDSYFSDFPVDSKNVSSSGVKKSGS
ncbi:hypothetical protein J2S16_003239 [Cytobacillus kochii]|nr:hypothetical protein [Cytobacillus kochii]